MTTNVSLTPALEEFARDCVKLGRYASVSEVVREGLRLLQEREERRRKFQAMIDEAYADVERNGTVSIEQALEDIDAIIDSAIARV
jgi:antitoxin ParD1/3/4